MRVPLSFTDEELNTITALASPLPPTMRSAFLRLIANRIAEYPPQRRGPGLVHRVAVEAQRDFLKRSSFAIGKSEPLRQGRRW
jgi:hypothetical protein